MAVSFPREPAEYRTARDELLQAEIELRRAVEAVAAARRRLPAGGVVSDDYEFEGAEGKVRLSELFGDHPTLVVYNFMYSPAMEQPCPSCTSILDSLDGAADHLTQRVGLAAVARSPLPRIQAFATTRGWRHLRLLSSAENAYNRDYRGEDASGNQWPMLNVFRRDRGQIHHFWGSELLYADADPGQEPRHADMVWPLWNVLDLTPDGRGTDWNPALSYDMFSDN